MWPSVSDTTSTSHKWRGRRSPRHLWDVDVVSDTDGTCISHRRYFLFRVSPLPLGDPRRPSFPIKKRGRRRKKRGEERIEEKNSSILSSPLFFFFLFFFYPLLPLMFDDPRPLGDPRPPLDPLMSKLSGRGYIDNDIPDTYIHTYHMHPYIYEQN